MDLEKERKKLMAFYEGGRAKGLLDAADLATKYGNHVLAIRMIEMAMSIDARSKEIATEAGLRGAV